MSLRKSMLSIALLAVASDIKAQNVTTFKVQVVAPPTCAVTLLSSPVSTSGLNLYAGQAGVINFNISACSAASLTTATATWDGIAVTLVAPFTLPVTAAQATVGSHSIVLTIPPVAPPMLTMNSPVQLPNAIVGQSYTADMTSLTSLLKNGQPCTTCIFSATNLPSGLVLGANGVITGSPVSSVAGGSFSFVVTDNPLFAMKYSHPYRYYIR